MFLFVELLQSALRYNETSNIYLGNNGVELYLADNYLFWDNSYFNDKKASENFFQMATIERRLSKIKHNIFISYFYIVLQKNRTFRMELIF